MAKNKEVDNWTPCVGLNCSPFVSNMSTLIKYMFRQNLGVLAHKGIGKGNPGPHKWLNICVLVGKLGRRTQSFLPTSTHAQGGMAFLPKSKEGAKSQLFVFNFFLSHRSTPPPPCELRKNCGPSHAWVEGESLFGFYLTPPNHICCLLTFLLAVYSIAFTDKCMWYWFNFETPSF